jgi:hypothetical protein
MRAGACALAQVDTNPGQGRWVVSGPIASEASYLHAREIVPRAQAQLLKSVGEIARFICAKSRLTTEGLRCRSSDVLGTATHTLFLSGSRCPATQT